MNNNFLGGNHMGKAKTKKTTLPIKGRYTEEELNSIQVKKEKGKLSLKETSSGRSSMDGFRA